jgi:hypothetical protein
MLLPHSTQAQPVTLAGAPGPAAGFVPGTLILTREGALPVEHLFAGDRIAVSGGGFATLRAVARTRTVGAEVVVLPPATLPGLSASLTLPVGHPVNLDDWRAQVVFGVPSVRTRAAALADRPGARLERRTVLTLLRLEFDRPQTIRANGLWLGCGTAG